MKSIIFKSEKKAKSYEIRAAIAHHIYQPGELMFKVRTDNIKLALSEYSARQIQVIEI